MLAESNWEKKPKDVSISFCEPGEAHAGMREILLWALMLCVTHRGKVDELNKWAKAVVAEKEAAEAGLTSWKPSAELWPRHNQLKVSIIHVPLQSAHKEFVWSDDVLEAMASGGLK